MLLIVASAAAVSTCRDSRKAEPPAQPEPGVPMPHEPANADQPPHDPGLEWEKVKAELDAIDDPDRWLVVTKRDPDAAGAWATGRFDESRNRLEITTRDVWEFTVDVGSIGVNWSKLVVLRIDDRNTELKKRDQSVYRFARGAQGQWEVRE